MKKKLALILTVTTIVMLLAGCSGTTKPGSSSSATASASASSTATADANKGLYFDKGLTVTIMRGEYSDQKMATDAPVIKAIKEKLNADIKLQIIPQADYDTKLATTLASNTMPDICDQLENDDVFKYAPTGMFLCLEDYKQAAPNYFKLVEADDRKVEVNKFRVDGKLYSFNKLEYNRIALAPLGLIRTDLLEEQNIPMPTSWDELYSAMLKIKEKHPDMYGFTTRNGTNFMLGQYAYPMGSGGFPTFSKTRGMYYEPNQDKYIYGPTSEDFKTVVQFMANAYKDGLLDPDYATTTKDQMYTKASSGKVMFTYDNNSFAGRIYNPALKEIDAKAKFDLVPPLKNSKGETRAYRYERDWPQQMVISSKVKDPENVVKLIDWFYSDEGRMITNFGMEGQQYDMVNGEPIIKQEIVDRNKNAPDVFMAIQGEIGVGLHGMGRYIDEATHKQVSDPIFLAQGEKIQGYTDAGLMQFLPSWPPFTQDEIAKVKDLELKLGNVFDQEIDSFITGKKSMDKWPELVEALKKQGSADLEKVFNDSYNRIK